MYDFNELKIKSLMTTRSKHVLQEIDIQNHNVSLSNK